jgi:hypothetical protein
MNFLNGVLNSQTEKLPGVLQNAEYLFVAGFQFGEKFPLLQLNCDLVAAKIALINFKTPEIAKMLHNVYKGSCTGKYPLRQPFTVDLLW